MDILDTGLDSSQDTKHFKVVTDDDVHLSQDDLDRVEGDDDHAVLSGVSQGLALDPSIQYQFRAETGADGQVTYRVVQVAPEDAASQVMTTASLPPGTQAVIQTPMGSSSPNSDTQLTYVQTSSANDLVQDGVGLSAANLGQVSTAGGQFYVMMSPQEVLGANSRNIAPRIGVQVSPKLEGRAGRDDRRRATHNEVERRRRDKINNWIVQLSKHVPDCATDNLKQASKGGILQKACEYIQELRNANQRLAESIKENEVRHVDSDLLSQQIADLKAENTILRNTIRQHGLIVQDSIVDNT